MELPTDLSSLASLPLDAGLFQARKAAPATNQDPDLFRQHLEPRSRAEQKSPDDSPAEKKTVSKRDFKEGPPRPAARRNAGDRNAPRGNQAPATDDAKMDKADRPTTTDESQPPAETTGTPAVAQADTHEEIEQDLDTDSQAIVEELLVAVPVASIAVESTPDATPAQEAIEVKPVDESAAAPPALPSEATHDESQLDQLGPEESANGDSENAETAAATQLAAPEPEQHPSKRDEKLLNTVDRSTAPESTIPTNDKTEKAETDRTVNTEITSSDQNSIPVGPAEEARDDSSGDREKKGGATKETSTLIDPPATDADSPASQFTHRPANSPGLQTAAPPTAAAAVAAEKVAASAGSSASPRSVGAIEGAAPHRLPQHLVGKPAESTGGEVKLTEAEQVRLLQRVARAFQTAQQREGEVRLRLSPPELGAIKLEIKVQDGVMSARVEAETPAAQSLLLDHLPALRERLAEQNVRLEQFDVHLPGRQSQGQNEGRDSQNGAGRSPAALAGRERDSGSGTELTTTAQRAHDGKLNVFI